MREKMLICLFLLVSAVFFVSCGEETSSEQQTFSWENGTTLNRDEVRKVGFKAAPKVVKPTPLRQLNTQTWGPVSTGQTQCFDHEKQIECPEKENSRFFYQDRNRFGTRSFSSTNDGQTIYDDLTRRSWAKHIKENVTWYEAKYYCESLRMAGKRWRIPTTAELRSLINYGQINPAIDPVFYQGYADKTSISKQFWASDHSHFNSEAADDSKLSSSWIINFYDGFVEYSSRYNTYNVRCVTEGK